MLDENNPSVPLAKVGYSESVGRVGAAEDGSYAPDLIMCLKRWE